MSVIKSTISIIIITLILRFFIQSTIKSDIKIPKLIKLILYKSSKYIKPLNNFLLQIINENNKWSNILYIFFISYIFSIIYYGYLVKYNLLLIISITILYIIKNILQLFFLTIFMEFFLILSLPNSNLIYFIHLLNYYFFYLLEINIIRFKNYNVYICIYIIILLFIIKIFINFIKSLIILFIN